MNDPMILGSYADKAEFNQRAKISMREYLRAKTWPEKVRSIERMNAAQKIAKQAMREALQAEAEAPKV